MKIILSKPAKKRYRKLRRELPHFDEDFKYAVELITQELYRDWLRIHQLRANLKDYQSFSLSSDLRVVYKLIKDGVYIAAIGTHEEV